MSGHLCKDQQLYFHFQNVTWKSIEVIYSTWTSTVPSLQLSSKGVKRNRADIAWSIQTDRPTNAKQYAFFHRGTKNGNGYQMFTGLLNCVSKRIGNISHITTVIFTTSDIDKQDRASSQNRANWVISNPYIYLYHWHIIICINYVYE